MRMLRKKDGFTLIELLIVILTGTIVTAAATTILLLALRINRKTLDIVERQSITRIMLSVLENMNSDEEYILVPNAEEDNEGNINLIVPDGSSQPVRSWSINQEDENGAAGNALIQYVPPIGMNKGSIQAGGQTMLGEISHSVLYTNNSPFDYVRDLYTFSVEIDGEQYKSTLYSRTQDEDWFVDDPMVDYEAGRNALINVAASQIGSTGIILEEVDRHYTKWYLDEYININIEDDNYKVPFYPDETMETWDKEVWSNITPWCATFVSWALKQCMYVNIGAVDAVNFLCDLPQDASVNYLWLENFVLTNQNHMKVNDASTGTYHTPLPGDLIFFEYYDPQNEPEDRSDIPESEQQNLIGLKILEDRLIEDLVDAMLYERNGWYINLRLSRDDTNYLISPALYLLLPETDKLDYVKYDVMKHYLCCVGDGLDHVGIVVSVAQEGGQTYVYTIEGNVSMAGAQPKVTLCKHMLKDSSIFGYATLKWLGNP